MGPFVLPCPNTPPWHAGLHACSRLSRGKDLGRWCRKQGGLPSRTLALFSGALRPDQHDEHHKLHSASRTALEEAARRTGRYAGGVAGKALGATRSRRCWNWQQQRWGCHQ